MGISSRHYLFLEDGSLRRVPRRVLHGLPFGLDAIPEFAGTRQRQADVVLENEGGKPVRILDVRGSFWIFDAEGSPQRPSAGRKSPRRSARVAASGMPSSRRCGSRASISSPRSPPLT